MVQTETIKIVVDDTTVERAAKKVLKLSDTLKIVRGDTVQVDSKFIKLNEGLTKSQANMLAMLKQTGATTKQMKEFSSILDQINKFSGVNPFDATTNPLAFVKKQKEELEKSIKLSEKYNDLTKDQVALVSRGIEFSRQKAKAEGLNLGQREAYVKKYTADMIAEMRAQNNITEAIKQQNAAHAHNLRVQEQLRKAEADRVAQQKELSELHQKNLAGNYARLESASRKEVQSWQAEQSKLSDDARKKAEKDQKEVITALRRDWAQTVDTNAKMKHPLYDYFRQMEIDSENAKKVVEKNVKFASEARMKNWATSVGVKSPELSAMSDFYKKQEVEARVHQQNMAEIERQGNLIIVNEQKGLIAEMGKREKMWKKLYGADHQAAIREEIKNNKEIKDSEEARNKIASEIGPNINAYNKSLEGKAKATQFATTADEKLNFQIEKMQAGLTTASSNQLYKYRESLIKAGVATDDLNKRVDKFQQKLLTKQEASPFARMQKDIHSTSREMDRLARGLSVQMGDVAVSLASGMNPLMVMIQQGDQIRGLITQSGIEGKELSKSMSLAAGQIATSFKGTAAAIGGFFTGAIVSAGKAVTDFGMKMPLLQKAFNSLGLSLALKADGGNKFADYLLGITRMIPAMIGSLIALSAVMAGAFLVALYQVTKQEDALAKQLALTGGSLGMNQSAALDYAKSLNAVGISTSKAVDVITAMAKEGGFAASEIQMIALAASDMSKYFDISIEDTVKSFAKLKEEPTKALAEIAKATGYVSEETMKLVMQLEQQGRKSEAAALAMKAYADSLIEQKNRVKEEYSNFAMFFMTLGSAISDFWNNKIKGSLYKASPSQVLTDQISNLKSEISGIESNLKSLPGFLTPDNTLLNQKKEELRILQSQLGAIVRVSGEQERIRIEQSRAAGDLEKTEALRIESLTSVQTKQEEIKRITNEITANSARWGKESDHVLVRQARIKQLNKEIAEIQNKKPPKTEADKIEDYGAGLIEQATNAYKEHFGAVEEVTKAEILRQKLQSDPKWQKLPKDMQNQVSAILDVVDASQKQVKAEEEKAKGLAVVNNLLGKADDLGKEYYSTQDKLFDLAEKYPEYTDAVYKALAALEETTPAAKANAAAKKALADTLDANTLALDNEYNSLMLEHQALYESAEAHKRKVGMLQIEIQYQKELAAVQDAISKGLTDPAEIEKRLLQAVGNKTKAEDLLNYKVKLEFSDDFKRLKAYSDVFQNTMDGMADVIANFAKTGKMNFGDLVDNMIADIIRLEVKMYTSKMMNQLGGISGIVGSIFGSWGGGNPANAGSASFNTSALTNPVLQAKGGAWDNGIQAFAKGGSFTNSIVDSPTLFKFAKGTGLMGEAGPEAIMPLKRGADGSLGVVNNSGSSNVEVIINNNSTAQATATETTDSRGNRRIEVTIGSMVASEVSRSGSETQKSLTNNFGLKQQLIRR